MSGGDQRAQPFVGPQAPIFPGEKKPEVPTWRTLWDEGYDLPRIWDAVRGEGDQYSWEQVQGFANRASLYWDQAGRLRNLVSMLYEIWPPDQSPAAAAVNNRLDQMIRGMHANATAAESTSRAVNDIVSALVAAKERIGPLNAKWHEVTSDWTPEWWDEAAAKLNWEAAQVMYASDNEVKDHSGRILVPDPIRIVIEEPGKTGNGGDEASGDEAGAGRSTADGRIPPPVPGRPPIASPHTGSGSPGTQPGSGPVLGGVVPPTTVPAAPGQPVSMLPIYPGSPFAPHGGAYVLPGPGVGPTGYVVPMPPPSSAAGRRVAGAGMAGRAGPGGGMMPVPMGMAAPGAGGRGGGAEVYRQVPNTVWPVAQGVPPVIQPDAGLPAVHPEQVTADPERAFKDWFTELATPWRVPGADGADPAPLVTFRRGDNPQ